MILLTSKETGLPAYIWVKELQSMESHGGSSPFTRIFLQDPKQHHEYTLDVLESKAEISKRIKHNRLQPGGENSDARKALDESEY